MARRPAPGDVKARLLDAVGKLALTRELARVTTRDIAARAGVAEGTMYNHFGDKSALLVAFLQCTAPETMRPVMADLPLQIGQATVRKNLEMVVAAVLAFNRRVAPVICSLLADLLPWTWAENRAAT